MSTQNSNSTNTLTQAGRYLIVISAFLGWFFAGMHLGTTSLAMSPAAKDLLRNSGQYEVVEADRETARAQIEKDGSAWCFSAAGKVVDGNERHQECCPNSDAILLASEAI